MVELCDRFPPADRCMLSLSTNQYGLTMFVCDTQPSTNIMFTCTLC